MLERLKQMNRGLLELCTGILFLGVAMLIVGSFLAEDIWRYGAALGLGVVLALITAYHMYRCLDRALSPGTDAGKVVTGSSLVRYVCILVVLGIAAMTGKLNVLVIFLGLMTLKLGAYLQPLTHRVYNKIFHEVDPIPQPMPEESGENMEAEGIVDDK